MTFLTALRPFPDNAEAVSRNREAVGRCERFAGINHGVIPRHVAVAEGLDDSAISRLIRSGTWSRLAPRAYGVRGAPVTWRSRLAAVQGHLESDFVFSHRTAGALHQLEWVPEGHLEIITNRSITLPGVTVHRLRSALPRIVHIDGMPVSNGTRTVLDLFAVLSPRSAELTLEDALRKKITTIERLWDEYESLCRPGRNGCKSFGRALLTRDHRDGTLQSRMEAKLRRIVSRLPGEQPIPQVRAEVGDSTSSTSLSPPSNWESRPTASDGTWARPSGTTTCDEIALSRASVGPCSTTAWTICCGLTPYAKRSLPFVSL